MKRETDRAIRNFCYCNAAIFAAVTAVLLVRAYFGMPHQAALLLVGSVMIGFLVYGLFLESEIRRESKLSHRNCTH